ncbi:unnamed protein product [Didymodactylos carnosus]|uniref:Uncharacterized protein n=1 Tax=Didymodactylos carnosus TaxID=1234261 RepID=A0A814T4L0_9BILA|nr:unnamed protein product [Didymodactylos carnosus]CAF3920386.1 unnamed protein product [Didymodactylos carnosus]
MLPPTQGSTGMTTPHHNTSAELIGDCLDQLIRDDFLDKGNLIRLSTGGRAGESFMKLREYSDQSIQSYMNNFFYSPFHDDYDINFEAINAVYMNNIGNYNAEMMAGWNDEIQCIKELRASKLDNSTLSTSLTQERTSERNSTTSSDKKLSSHKNVFLNQQKSSLVKQTLSREFGEIQTIPGGEHDDEQQSNSSIDINLNFPDTSCRTSSNNLSKFFTTANNNSDPSFVTGVLKEISSRLNIYEHRDESTQREEMPLLYIQDSENIPSTPGTKEVLSNASVKRSNEGLGKLMDINEQEQSRLCIPVIHTTSSTIVTNSSAQISTNTLEKRITEDNVNHLSLNDPVGRSEPVLKPLVTMNQKADEAMMSEPEMPVIVNSWLIDDTSDKELPFIEQQSNAVTHNWCGL